MSSLPWSIPNNRHMSCSWLTDFLSARRNSALHAILSYLLKLLNESPNEITNSSEDESSRKTVHFVKELKGYPSILPNLVFSEFTAFFSDTKTSSHGSSSYNGYLPGRQIICWSWWVDQCPLILLETDSIAHLASLLHTSGRFMWSLGHVLL